MMFKKSNFLILSFILFTCGYIFSNGFYHIGELFILLLIFVFLLIFYFKPQFLSKTNIPANSDSLNLLLKVILVLNIAILGGRLGDSAQTNWMLFSLLNRILAAIALVIGCSFFTDKMPKALTKMRFPILIIIAVLIRVFAIISAPNPTIDVFHLLKDGPKMLSTLENPYKLEYPAPYGVYNPTIIFVYGPLTPFIFYLSDTILNDPRYTLVVFDILSAFLIYKIGKRTKVAQNILLLVVSIFLFHPLFPFMTEQAWVEPVIFSFLLFSIYLHIKNPRSMLSSLPMGALLAIKLVYILPLLVFLKNQKAKFGHYLILVLIPVLISLPFLIIDKDLFLRRTLFDSGAIQSYPRLTNSSLNVSAVLLKYFHIVISAPVVGILSLLFALVLVSKKTKTINSSTLSLFLAFFFMFMIAPYVVLNYFAFLGNILLVCFLLNLKTGPDEKEYYK